MQISMTVDVASNFYVGLISICDYIKKSIRIHRWNIDPLNWGTVYVTSDLPPHCSTVEWKLFTSNLSNNFQIFVLSRWKKTMVFIVNIDSWCIRRVTSGEGAYRAGGGLARELNKISETLLRPWDSIPYRSATIGSGCFPIAFAYLILKRVALVKTSRRVWKGPLLPASRVVIVRHAHLSLSADLGAATMRWSADPITRPIVGDRAVEISQLDCC